jgi:microcystin-dependent protein
VPAPTLLVFRPEQDNAGPDSAGVTMKKPNVWALRLAAAALLLPPAVAAGSREAGADGEYNERIAEELIAQAEEGAGRKFDPRGRKKLHAGLSSLSAIELDAIRQRANLGGGVTFPELGESNRELVYTPVSPCRIIDTRLAGGSMGAGTTRPFNVTGGDMTSQGGSSTGCAVPFGPATVAMINFVVADPGGAGNLRVWAYPDPNPPGSSILNFGLPGSGLNIANAVAIPICNPTLTPGCFFDFRVLADGSPLHVIADVVGYYERFKTEQAYVPPGAILEYGGATAPSGYLLCDGSAVSRVVYDRLFAAIGTAYGAPNATSFNLPDFRGRFARGRDAGTGRDPDAASRTESNPGGLAGDNVGSLQVDQLRLHTHQQQTCGGGTGGNGIPAASCSFGAPSVLFTLGSGGGETRPVNVYVNKIIRY